MQLAILGDLLVTDDADRPVEVGGARLRALLTRLALTPGRAVGADALVEDLWGDAPPADRLNALQSLVSRLRRVLPGLVESGPTGYRLALAPGCVDAAEFERLADEGRQAPDPATASAVLGRALALWRGPALADAVGVPWADAAAERLAERRLAAVEDRVEAELQLGRPVPLLPELTQLARDHPLREQLRGLQVRALYAAGRQAEALEAYEDVRRRLADELGVDPSPALREIHLNVLRAVPEPAPAAIPRTNLPAPLTSFVGRDADLAAVAELLGRHRLVTLVGPGGAGKTRLAGEAATRTLDRFPDGGWLAELAPVTGGDAIPQAVLDAVGLSETRLRDQSGQLPSSDALSRLVDLLQDRTALLVLDNCEHLIEPAARVAAELLARCPRLRVLATSREPLGITGEALAPVAPLGLPPAGASPAEALEHPAVRLLADRAAAVRPGFAVDAGTVGPVTEICRRLDGMPLAIELAAARLRTLPVTEVAARLDDRFRLLTGGSRAALPRHQTLRAVVAWSWDLLTPAEALLADRLAVFPGGIGPDPAEAVGSGGPVVAADVPDLLAALVDKSLLQIVPGAEPRYRMLETLREFGVERLAADGGAEEVRRRHMHHFLAFAQEAEPHLRRSEQLTWFARLTAERDNLIAALRFAVDTGDADTAVRLATALAWYWTARGEHATAANWLTAAADLPGDAPPEDRAVCLVIGGISAAGASGDFAMLTRRVEQARALQLGDWAEHPMLSLLEPLAGILADDDEATHRLLSAESGPTDPWSRATRHFLAAMVHENAGEFEEYRDSIKKALEGYREAGERWGLATTLAAVGTLRLADGDLAGSMAAYDEAHRYMSEITAVDDATYTRTRLATVHLRAGDVGRARAELTTARAEAERTGSRIGLLGADLGLYEVAWVSGDLVEARRHAESALEYAEAFSGAPAQAVAGVLGVIASLDAEDGDVDGARARIRRAVTLPMADRDMPVMGSVALAAALIELRGGEPELAARIFGAALALRGTEDRASPQVEQLRRELGEALGPEELDRHYGEGAALPRPQAIALLRGDPTMAEPPADTLAGPAGDPTDGDPTDGPRPDSRQPHGARPDGAQPDGAQPHGARPDGRRTDGGPPDDARPDRRQPHGARADGTRPDGAAGADPEVGAGGDARRA